VPVLEGIEKHSPGAPAYGDVIRAFKEVGEALVREVERDRLLHLVLHNVCRLVEVRRGSLYLLHEDSGLFHGEVGVVADTWVDDQIKQYRCGVPADRFTHEILETRAPVLIADAQNDPRPIRATMRTWKVRSILGVPMILGVEVRGLMFLDDIERPHDFSETQQALASAFADMAAVAITTAQRAEDLAHSMRTVARQNNLLRKAVAMEERLTSLALRGGTIRDVTSMLAELIDEPCAVHDTSFRRIATALPPGDETLAAPQLFEEAIRTAPEVSAALKALPEREPQILGPFPRAGLHRRCLIVPVRAREETWGYLLVAEAKTPLRTMQTLVASRAAAIIALNVTFQRSAAETETYAREALIRRLIDGDAPSEAMAARAQFHGVRSGKPYVAAMLASCEDGGGPDGLAIEDAAAEAGFAGAWMAGVEGAARSVVLELPQATDDLEPRFAGLLEALGSEGKVYAAVSEICHTVEDLRAAHREAAQVLQALRTFAVGTRSPRIVTARELGAARMLLASATREDADRLLHRALGPLADTENPKAAEILHTLQAFLSASWGIRRAAAQLHVHENTVRYRLGRLAEETGRDVLTDPRAQLDTQLALLILRLEGRLPDDDAS
jgi:DNA-binding PucR family transcriptional regulator